MDARLPRPHPGTKCPGSVPYGTDRQLRVNVNTVVEASLTSVGAEPGSSTQGHSRKRKRIEEGNQWSRVGYTITLGMRPRDFVIRLASFCQTWDVHRAIQELAPANLPSVGGGTLVSLVAEHGLHTRNSNLTRFWQSVIEVQVALRCERFVCLPVFLVYRSDHGVKFGGKRQAYMEFEVVWFWWERHRQGEVCDSPWAGEKAVSIDCWRYVYLFVPVCTILFLMFHLFVASLYILPLIAFSGLKTRVRDMSFAEVSDVSRLFRTPDCKFQPASLRFATDMR